MGLIYRITRTILPGRWSGLRPSTLDELIDKTDNLWTRGIDLKNLQIVPIVTEEFHDNGVGLVHRGPYSIYFLAEYSDGKKLHIQEDFSSDTKNENGADSTEEGLVQYAHLIQKKLHTFGYKNVFVSPAVYQDLNNAPLVHSKNSGKCPTQP